MTAQRPSFARTVALAAAVLLLSCGTLFAQSLDITLRAARQGGVRVSGDREIDGTDRDVVG